MKNFWFLKFVFAFILGGMFMTALVLYNEPVYIQAEVVAENEQYTFFSDGTTIYTYEGTGINGDVPHLIQVKNGEVLISWDPS